MRTTILLFLIFCLPFILSGQTKSGESQLDTALNNLLQQVSIFPQEKIYLQTDRPYYISGEQVFFRAFLLNAASHHPEDLSRYVYVELIDPLDSVVIRNQIKGEDKSFSGVLALPEDLPQGDYKIRAYTRLMENLGEDYFYIRYIHIADPHIADIETETSFNYPKGKQVEASVRFLDVKTKEVIIPKSITFSLNKGKEKIEKTDNEGWVHIRFDLSEQTDKRILYTKLNLEKGFFSQYLRVPYPKENLSVSFYPEGGQLLGGQINHVAFKALLSTGNAADITGKLFDSKDNQIVDFKTIHEGMGSFTFFLDPEETYYAICTNEIETIRIPLPGATTEAYSLKALWHQNKLWLKVNKPLEAANKKLYLVVHSRGNVFYAQEWDNSREELFFNQQDFPSGVSHFILLTETFQPLSERLVFAFHDNDLLKPTIRTDKQWYKTRDLIQADVRLDTGSSFAVSVTDDKDVKIDTSTTILSEILLNSELRGHINNPSFYFQKENAPIADLLMMTHGWTRYDIPKALRGEYRYLTIPNELSQSFSGMVKGGLLSKPYKGAKVMIISTNSNFSDVVETDDSGHFEFKDFEFPDSTNYVIQALTKKGDYTVELLLDKIAYPEPLPFFIPTSLQREINLDYVAKADLRYTYENGMRMIYLPEVVIKSSHTQKRKYVSPYYLEPDHWLSQEEIERSGASTIGWLLNRLPGITYNGTVITMSRGVSSINAPDGLQAPLIIIDGMRVNSGSEDMTGAVEALNLLSPSDIAQVDVLRSPAKLVIYGTAAIGGAIEIFTKRGDQIEDKLKFNIKHIVPLGYQSPVEFYSPQYDTPEAVNNPVPDLRTTIYWKPDVKIDEMGGTSLDFYSADQETTYTLVIEGISDNGIPIRGSEKIIVASEQPDYNKIQEVQGTFQNTSLSTNQQDIIDWIEIKTDINIKKMEKQPDKTFQISSKEITNAQYCDFLNEMGIHPNDSSIVWKLGEYNSTWFSYNNESSRSADDLFVDPTTRSVTYGDNVQIDYINGRWVSNLGLENYPMIYVSWYGAKAFCDFYRYRLPSEEEWEYAARLGNQKVNENSYSGKTRKNKIGDVAWYIENSDSSGSSRLENGAGTHAVGTKSPNLIQLYDMSGNVWEWTSSQKDIYYMFRGGSWNEWPKNCDVSYNQGKGLPKFRDCNLGFRVCKW